MRSNRTIYHQNMPNNVRYSSVQPSQQQSHSNLQSYQQQQQQQHHRHHHHHHHHSFHRASPIPPNHNLPSYSNHRLNSNNSNVSHHPQTPISTPLSTPTQSSAYFLDRIDLENYTTHTLKQAVEDILSKTNSKGLKVKLSLPDDGLIIDNITDPTQSWIFKTSELLYFWRDPYYLNVIVVVTMNRSRHHANHPYSASIFRLRGTETAQLFLHQAQKFFVNLSASVSASNVSKPMRYKSLEKLTRTDTQTAEQNASSNHKTKTRSLSIINEQSNPSGKATNNRHQSPPAPSTIRRVTRAEFDPGKAPATTDSIASNSNNRTYSDTASSTDSQTTNSTKEILSFTKKLHNGDDDDDKMTTISNNLSGDQIAELMRELKELRNEIASLKLENRVSHDTRSMSTSPLAVQHDHYKKTIDSSTTTSSSSFPDITSQSEVDAETQTDFSLVNQRRRHLSKKNKKTMIGSGGVSTLVKKNIPQLTIRNSRRTLSNSSTNTGSDPEDPVLELPSQVNESSNDTTNPILNHQQYQPIILAAPPRPVLIRNPNNFLPLNNITSYSMSNGNPLVSNSNPTEEGSTSPGLAVTIDKEMPQFLSGNISSSSPDLIGPPLPLFTVGSGSFRSPLEPSKTPTDHIYENVPILIQSNQNRESYYNIPIINVDEQQQQQQQQNPNENYVYYAISNNHETDSQQQQYLMSAQDPSSATDNNSSEVQSATIDMQQQKPQIISVGRHRNQPIYFANHLTNPIFNVDKQLLINTIANQFGVDLNSPQLQQLITNQHLFATRKRTFANMVWQLTPDEETDLCSSPITTQDAFDVDTFDANNSAARSILKATKRFRSTAKRRSISWDSALE